MQFTVLALDYALAPERPFPAALNDICAAFHQVVVASSRFGTDPAKVSIGGDSSGGNLALAAALVLQKEGLKPHSPVLYYPVAEARADGSDSWREFATGYGMDAAFMDACFAAYLNGHAPSDPLVSPAFASDEQLAEPSARPHPWRGSRHPARPGAALRAVAQVTQPSRPHGSPARKRASLRHRPRPAVGIRPRRLLRRRGNKQMRRLK